MRTVFEYLYGTALLVMVAAIAWAMWTPAKVNIDNQRKIIKLINSVSATSGMLKTRITGIDARLLELEVINKKAEKAALPSE